MMDEPITNTHDVLEILTFVAQTHKKNLCEEEGGPADGVPMLFGIDPNNEPFMMPDTLDGHPTDNLPLALGALGVQLDEKNGTMAWQYLAYAVEAYMKQSESDELDNDDWERGAYQREFENDITSNVQQVIVLTIIPWEGDILVASLPYKYGDDGMPVWGEQVVSETGAGGAITDTFELFRFFCHKEGNV